MKKMHIVLALLALVAAGTSAQASSYIGMFNDQAMTDCVVDMTTPYVSVSVYFVGYADPAEIQGVSAVEFKVTNWPAAGGIITPHWSTSLVIGNPATDLSLAWNPYLASGVFQLGYVEFLPLSDPWVGSDYSMMIAKGDPPNVLGVLIVDATTFDEHIVDGWNFTFNCTGVCPCTTGVDVSNWGSIKSLY